MASIHKQKGRVNWFCAYTSPDGRRHFKSTGSADAKEARRICALWENASAIATRGRLTVDKARTIIANGVSEIMAAAGEDLPSTRTADFFNTWLKRKELEAGERTHARYAVVVRQLLDFLGPRQERDLAQFRSREITEFRDHLSRKVSPGTTNIALKIIRSALNQAKRDSLVDVNEAERVTLLKRARSFDRRPFTVPELRRVLAVANEEWRGMILVGLYTGLRLGDIALLTWAGVDLLQAEIILTTQKTERRQVIPLARPLLRHLEGLRAGDHPLAPVFPEACTLKLGNPHGGPLSNQFYQILVAAGLAQSRNHKSLGKGRDAKRQLGGLSFHCLRHTATSLLKNAGVSDVIARDIIGHDSVAVSAHYTHIDSETKRQALNKMPDVFPL